MSAVPGRRRAVCSATRLSLCVNLSCVRHVGFNSEDARKSWNFPKGEMTGTAKVCIYHRGSDEGKRRELVVARTSPIPRAQLIFIDHESSNYGWALQ